MPPLAEKKQNLCVAMRAAKLKVRVQRRIAASRVRGWLSPVGPVTETAGDLWGQTQGTRAKRKHPRKVQMAQKRVSCIFTWGLGRWKSSFLLACRDAVEGMISRSQKGKEKLTLKIIINTIIFKLLCLPNCSNGSSMSDPPPCKKRKNKTKQNTKQAKA